MYFFLFRFPALWHGRQIFALPRHPENEREKSKTNVPHPVDSPHSATFLPPKPKRARYLPSHVALSWESADPTFTISLWLAQSRERTRHLSDTKFVNRNSDSP